MALKVVSQCQKVGLAVGQAVGKAVGQLVGWAVGPAVSRSGGFQINT